MIMRHTMVLVAALSHSAASAEEELAGFWRRGRVRELLVSGLPKDDAALAEWARCGVNCELDVRDNAFVLPALAQYAAVLGKVD